MEKSVTVIQLVELHMVGLNSVIMAKNLYEEYMENSDKNSQNPLNYDYIVSVIRILPSSLQSDFINNINDNYQNQINWIIEKLEEIKERAQKAKLFYLDRRDSSPDTTVNFIEKKTKQTKSKYQHKKKIRKL